MQISARADYAIRALCVLTCAAEGCAVKADDTLSRALAQFYAAGISPDWWKLPPPSSAAAWQHIERVIEANDPYCRGVVMLGLSAPMEALAASFAAARDARSCRGFAVGRTIFEAPAREWLAGRIDDEGLIDRVAANYQALIDAWRAVRPPRATGVKPS